MSHSPTRIFIETGNLSEFRETIISLEGDFIFDTDEMFRLGEAYFNRFPDSYSHRNSQEVLMGYELARICILEKAIMEYDSPVRECLREITRDVSLIGVRIPVCIGEYGYDKVMEISAAVMKSIDCIKLEIERLPLGMVKERFIGGIAIFYNVSYLVRLALEAQKK